MSTSSSSSSSSTSLAVSIPLVEKRSITNYQSFIYCSKQVTIFLSSRIALIIDKEAKLDDILNQADSLYKFTLLLCMLEQLVQQFTALTGKHPSLKNSYEGRMRVEVAFLPNAAGLAHHGIAGIAIGPAFVKGMYDNIVYDAKQIEIIKQNITYITYYNIQTLTMDHVCTYETMRNYIFPDEFTPVFDYSLLEDPINCWGWVNQGFVNLLGCLILPNHINFTYYGHTKEGFINMMVQHLDKYINGKKETRQSSSSSSSSLSTSVSSYTWEDVFLHERLPWDNNVSLDNIYSGLLAILYQNYGANYFIYRWFTKAIPLLLQRCPKSKQDYRTAAENFYLASCIGANQNLQDYFIQTLRWPLSKEFLQNNLVLTLLGITND